jgi:spore coat polysaccharide biosynthesis protein SpsF
VLAISEGEENLTFTRLADEWGLPYVIGSEQNVLERHIKAAHSVDADIILRVTTENPFVHQDNLDELIEHHIDTGSDLTVCESLPDGTYTEVITVSALEYAYKFGEERHYNERATLFIFENPDVFKIECIPAPEELARPDLRLTIDTPEDLIVARAIFGALEPELGIMPPLLEIIKYLDTHEEVRSVNAQLHSTTSKLWH